MPRPFRSPGSLLVLVVVAIGAACSAPRGPGSARPALSTAGLDPAAAAIARQCSRSIGDAKAHCYEKALIAVVDAEGVAPAMSALEQLGERDPDVRHLGHVFAHHIGLAGYRPGRPVHEAFESCTPLFQSGCYHGVVQAYFAEIQRDAPERVIEAAQLDQLCGGHRGATGDTWLLFQCVHGVGHGLVGIFGGDLPRALEGCDLLPNDWEREGCYGGAFMEVVVSATMPHHAHDALTGAGGHESTHAHHLPGESGHQHGDHRQHHGGDQLREDRDHHEDHRDHHHHEGHDGHGDHHHHAHHPDHGEPGGAAAASTFRPLDPADPHHPCSSLTERYLNSCYAMQTSAVLFWNQGDTKKGVEFCLDAPVRYRPVCFSSLGRDISAYTAQHHARALAECGRVPTEFRPWCYSGVAKHFVDLTADPADALAFCARIQEESGRRQCFQATGEQIALLTHDPRERAALCAVSAEDERRACILGADLPDPEATGTP